MPAAQPSKPRGTRLGRPSSASRMSTSAACQLKRRLQPRTRAPLNNDNSQSTKQARLPVQPCDSHPSSANQQLQTTIQPTPVPLARSGRGVAPNAIDVDPIEYMLDAFDNWISHILGMPSAMQSFIRIRLYRIMFTDFARQQPCLLPH